MENTSGVVDSLVEMGFSRERAELAASCSGSSDLTVVMDWLLSHEEELEVEEQRRLAGGPTQQAAVAEPSQPVEEPPVVVVEKGGETEEKSSEMEQDVAEASAEIQDVSMGGEKTIKCEDCGKLFETQEEVQFHAIKSGHQNFSESEEKKRPLTDQEKEEQLAKIMEKLKQRRLAREAREKEEAQLKEKIRIKSGKELLEAKKKHKELEMKKMVEQKKREKEEERLAKQRVREQIKQDKERRKNSKFPAGEAPPQEAPPQQAPPTTRAPVTTNYNEVKLQIRLLDGSSKVQVFGAKEPLSAVRVFIELNCDNVATPFELFVNYPRRVFELEDYEKSLDSLGLAPTATLFIKKA